MAALKIGEVVRDYRLRKGMTQLELSQRLGYDSMQFISLFERGLSKVPHKVIGKLVVILNIPQQKIIDHLVKEFTSDLKEAIEEGKKSARADIDNFL